MNHTLREQIHTERRQPDPEAEGWGELRSLAHEPWSGGEQWAEWSAWFEDENARRYVQDVWDPPSAITDLESARHAFLFRALIAWERAHKEAGTPCFGATLSHQELASWRDTQSPNPNAFFRAIPTPTLPPYLSACVQRIGGHLLPEDGAESEFSFPEYVFYQNDLATWHDHVVRERTHRVPLSAWVSPFLRAPKRAGVPEYLKEGSFDLTRLPTQDELESVEGELMFGIFRTNNDSGRPKRHVISILTSSPWADHLVAVGRIDGDLASDEPDSPVMWPLIRLHDGDLEPGEDPVVRDEDMFVYSLTWFGHLIDWLHARVTGV